MPPSSRVSRQIIVILAFSIPLLAAACAREPDPIAYASTVAGLNKEFGEPFGVAARKGRIFVSDGEKNEIHVIDNGKTAAFASGLNTPSAIAFDRAGNLLVADTGSHTIKSVDPDGTVSTIAGVENKAGFVDGPASTALFRAPIGIAVDDSGRIFVADTYNDRIRVIENGDIRTIAGGEPGFADGSGEHARLRTPAGIAIFQDKLLVADTQNHRIRVVEPDGQVWTLAGNGGSESRDGLLLSASFEQPTGITVSSSNEIFATDGDAIRKIGGYPVAAVTTVSRSERGFADGNLRNSRFNLPSGIAFNGNNIIVADSDNRVVRLLSSEAGKQATPEEIASLRDTSEAFRSAQPPRWPYDPPDAPRDVAGTFGELRGTIKPGNDRIWFHNGLDIAGAYGETARFIRNERVLRPVAAENFNTLRELLRMPQIGYIHIRLGRDQTDKVFADDRFQFTKDPSGKLTGVRVPRGSAFKAGDPIGTLNAMNHVHLIAGRSGWEMNAIDALVFPGIGDSRPPTIERAWLTDPQGRALETKASNGRIQVSGKIRIIARSYDQMDGNSDRRRLGLYRYGYQLLHPDASPAGSEEWTGAFSRLPDNATVPLVYAQGSNSGATGETVLNYIVTSRAGPASFREDFLDTAAFPTGSYIVRVLAADYFGNVSHTDIPVEVVR